MKVYKPIYDEYELLYSWWKNFIDSTIKYDANSSWDDVRDIILTCLKYNNLQHTRFNNTTCIYGEEKDVLFFIMKYS